MPYYLNLSRQTEVINKYNLNRGGVCSGLVVEYFRHNMTKERKNKTPNFAQKVKRKLTATSEKFGKRVGAYQNLQVLDSFYLASKNKLYSKITKENLSSFVGNSSEIYIGLHDHAIGMRVVIDKINKSKITGIKIYDPNGGEYVYDNIDKDKLAEDEFLKKINSMISYYETRVIITYDASEMLSAFDIINSKDHSKEEKDISNAKIYILVAFEILKMYALISVCVISVTLVTSMLLPPSPLSIAIIIGFTALFTGAVLYHYIGDKINQSIFPAIENFEEKYHFKNKPVSSFVEKLMFRNSEDILKENPVGQFAV